MDDLTEMLGNFSFFFLFFCPKNTSHVIHDVYYYKPDVASVCYVALNCVKDEEL